MLVTPVDRDIVAKFVRKLVKEANLPEDAVELRQARPLSKSYTM